MKGYRTKLDKSRAARDFEKQPKNKKRDKSIPDTLRRPSRGEQALFDASVDVHNTEKHESRFEECSVWYCVSTRETLGIKGYMHRFDDPFLKRERDGETDDESEKARALNKRRRAAAQEKLHEH